MPLDADVFRVPPGYNAPQQVHITLGDQTGTAMTVSWVTASEPGNATVAYGRSPEKMDLSAQATHARYDYYNYTSGFIHHATLDNLKVTVTSEKKRVWKLQIDAAIDLAELCGSGRSTA
jgi:hypothetical protein